MEIFMYDADTIKEKIELNRTRYEDLLRIGQAPNWQTDQRTRDLWCLGKWIDEELEGHERRIEIMWYFNRTVRAEQNPFEVAAVVMNKCYSGEVIEEHYKRYYHQRR